MPTPTNVFQILTEAGLLDEAAIDRIRTYAAENQVDLAHAVLALGLATEDDLAAATAQVFRLPFVRLDEVQVEPDALLRIPRNQMLKYGILPVSVRNNVLTVVTCNPVHVLQIEAGMAGRGLRLKSLVVSQKTLNQLFEKYIRHLPYSNVQEATRSAFLSGFQGGGGGFLDPLAGDVTIGGTVDQILAAGVKKGASDIHLGHGKSVLKVRYRKDGSLTQKDIRMGRDNQDAIVNQLKVLAGVDVIERRRPQDGGFILNIGRGADARETAFRASFIPCEDGEKVCLRIASCGAALRPLEDVGMGVRNLEVMRGLLDCPSGLVLLTGPTGSGKTSTAYACLREVYRPELTVYTIEDPVEIAVPEYVQTRINEGIGVTFDLVLRSLLRQDPNVIFVGEIRDRETARIASEAALTGHLILSTLHTNDACSTPARILELGVEPYVAATAVRGIVAQRLVRKLCACRRPSGPPTAPVADLKERFGLLGDTLFEPVGCKDCNGSGFLGRVVLAEVLALQGGVADLVMGRASATEVRAEALRHGFRPLGVDGCEKALAGLTTLAEVQRAAGPVG